MSSETRTNSSLITMKRFSFFVEMLQIVSLSPGNTSLEGPERARVAGLQRLQMATGLFTIQELYEVTIHVL